MRTITWRPVALSCIPLALLLLYLFMPHWSKVSKVVGEAVDKSHRIGGQQSSAVCQSDDRRQLKEAVCELEDVNEAIKPEGEPDLKMIWVNNDQKIFFCRIGKCSSSSLRGYVLGMDEGTNKLVGYSYGKFQDMLANVSGFHKISHMPLAEAQSRYADYKKFLIVRHPLQRFVAGYYEVVKKHDPEHKIQNVTHVITDWILKDIRSIHWDEYHKVCHPCDLDYDLIVKMETFYQDTQKINEMFGQDAGNTMIEEKLNPNLTSAATPDVVKYQYDPLLGTIEKDYPELYGKLLSRYDADMRMFGYSWRDHASHCENDVNSCC